MRDRRRPAAHPPPVAQDPGSGGGAILDGGGDLPPQGDCRRLQEVQGVRVRRRGALHRGSRRHRPRGDGALRGAARGRGRLHGHLHQVVRIGGRVHRVIAGSVRLRAAIVAGRGVRLLHGPRVRHPGLHGLPHARWRGRDEQGAAEDPAVAAQRQPFPRWPRAHGLRGARRPRLAGDPRNALQSGEDPGVLARVPQAQARRRRRRVPGDAGDQVAGAVLHLGGAHGG
mmetsp:Transcript_56543/g.134349  ORF Transcript_56543/g.134349 Transcript_56543/m.134349 type:complete len:227 (+) Transcript_56543:989-1669(+)